MPMPYALCPMPYALCPMPYALCPMPYALCPMRTSYESSKGYICVYLRLVSLGISPLPTQIIFFTNDEKIAFFLG